MIDAVTGDHGDVTSHGGVLRFTVIHDVADEGVDATRIELGDLFDVFQVLAEASIALRGQVLHAVQSASLGRPHELNDPARGRTPRRARLLADRLTVVEARLRTIRAALDVVLEEDARHAPGEAATG